MSQHTNSLAPEIEEVKNLIQEIVSEETTAEGKQGAWSVVLEIICDSIAQVNHDATLGLLVEENEKKVHALYRLMREFTGKLKRSKNPELFEYGCRMEGVYHLMEVTVSRQKPKGYHDIMQDPQYAPILGLLLERGELDMGSIPTLLGIEKSISMKFLRALVQAGIVTVQNIGAHKYARLADVAVFNLKCRNAQISPIDQGDNRYHKELNNPENTKLFMWLRRGDSDIESIFALLGIGRGCAVDLLCSLEQAGILVIEEGETTRYVGFTPKAKNDLGI